MLTVRRPFGLNGHGLELGWDREFDRMFRDLAGAASVPAAGAPADVYETAGDYVVTLDLPGVGEKDVQITLEKQVLTVKAERRRPDGDTRPSYHLAERAYGPITRSFRLPVPVDPDKTAARFEHGVLTVTVPKSAESQSRTIAVKTGA